MKRILIIGTLLLGISTSLLSQGVNVYDLLTEPALDRPLSLHKGILSLHANYGHLNGNTYFDSEGTKLPFTEYAQSIIEHNYNFDLSYGIMEHLEFHTAMSFRNRHETLPTYLVDNHGNIGYEDRTTQTSGLSNLNMDLKYRLPAILEGFDMLIYGGLSTPVNKQHPDQPEHSINLVDPIDPGSSYVVEYQFKRPAGSPALSYKAGTQVLYAIDKLGLSLNLNMIMPFGSAETYNWTARLYGEEFLYQKNNYMIRPKGQIFGGVHLQGQAFPWFWMHAGYEHIIETPGWSDESGQAVALTRSTAGYISTGFEIQVSTHLRILQEVNIPITGSNLYSEFSIKTGITYSLVPLEKLYY